MDWNKARPSAATLEALKAAKDEDFPETYSGTTWKAAFRILNAVDAIDVLLLDPWNLPKKAARSIKGMDLTGFMVGYACSVLRQMHGASPGVSGAVVTLGKGVAEQPVITGTPEEEVKKALDGCGSFRVGSAEI